MGKVVKHGPSVIDAMFDVQNWLIRNGEMTGMESFGLYDFKKMTMNQYLDLMEPKISDPYIKNKLRKKAEYYIRYEKHRNTTF